MKKILMLAVMLLVLTACAKKVTTIDAGNQVAKPTIQPESLIPPMPDLPEDDELEELEVPDLDIDLE